MFFGFIRDVYLESIGIDSNQAKLQRLQKKQQKKADKILIPKIIKKMIQTISAFEIISSTSTMMMGIGKVKTLLMIKLILQVAISLSVFVLMFFRNKKTEIASIVLIGLFVLIQYLGIYMISL